jgi:ABC-type sugar transport system permease subunit
VGHYLLVSLPAVAIAIGVARLVGRHLEGERFFRIVFTGLVAIGAVLVAQGLAR